MEDRSFQARAEKNWGDALPDWVAVLALKADETNQSRCARDLRISVAQISQIIANKYAGRMETAETRVRGLYMKETLSCPALGEISKSECLDWREKAAAFSGHNEMRVRMFRACRKCPFNKEP